MLFFKMLCFSLLADVGTSVLSCKKRDLFDTSDAEL